MDSLIKALQILSKYLIKGSYEYNFPTWCEHQRKIKSSLINSDSHRIETVVSNHIDMGVHK